MNAAKPLVLAMSVCFLAACAGKGDTPKLDYQSENNKIVSLEIPPDLNDPRNGDLYTLPGGVSASPDATKRTAQQQQNRVLAEVKNARIERRGTQRWLVIEDKKAEEVWPLLRAFWQEAGFTIHSEEPRAGLMETDWAENRAKLPNQGLRRLFEAVGIGGIYSTSERDKFNIRIERNDKNGVDVFFTHRGMEEVYDGRNKDTTVWQPRANDPNLEAAFLARFMQYVGVDEAVINREMQVKADAAAGTEFAKREADSVLVFGTAERNVNRIGSALDRSGLTVQQFVAERGLFVVQTAPTTADAVREAAAKDAKPGFFGRLFGGGKKEQAAAPEQQTRLLVALEQVENGQRIHLLDAAGKPYSGENKARWLDSLYRELR